MGPDNIEDDNVQPEAQTTEPVRDVKDTSEPQSSPADNNTKDEIKTTQEEIVKETKEKKLSVRDSIKGALKQESENNPDLKRFIKEDTQISSENETNKEAKEPKEVKEKIPAPDNWGKKNYWDKLPMEAQKDLIKREQEVSEGIKKYADKAKESDEINSLFHPQERQWMQQNNTRTAQIVSELVNWNRALSHAQTPDDKIKILTALGKQFGVDISNVVPKQQDNNSQTNTEVPEWATRLVDAVDGKFQTYEQQMQQQAQQAQQQEAANFVGDWSKDKPHFQKVKPLIYSLLTSGTVKLKENGQLDLDRAYDLATKADPEVSALLEQEKTLKKEQERFEKEKKDAVEKKAKLDKAKGLNVSIRPNAPASNLNGKAPVRNNQPVSVRDSIMQALAEHK